MSGFHFICYSHADATAFAEQLEQALRAATPPIFTWRDHSKLVAGGHWPEDIESALRDCDSLLFVMTRDSVRPKSECLAEWNWVHSKYKKPTILLKLHRDAEHYRLALTQQIVFTGDFEKLLNELRATIADLFSPQGLVKLWSYQLAEAERELGNASDDATRTRLTEQMGRLRKQIKEQETVAADPQAADQAVRERIESEMESERRSQSAAAPAAQGRIINAPPLEVPAHFIGRTEETGRLDRWARDPACRIITLHGRSGSGKTTLVCRLLQTLRDERDASGSAVVSGIVYLGSSTRAITFPNLFEDLCRLLPPETAAGLLERFRDARLGAEAKAEALLAEFRSGRVIVYLDSFEDLLDPETFEIKDPDILAAFSALLKRPQCPVSVIITSNYVPGDLLKIPHGRQERWELARGMPPTDARELLLALDADGQLGMKDLDPKLLDEAWRRTGGNPRALVQVARLLAANPDNTLSELLERLPEDLTQVLVGEAFANLDRIANAVIQAVSICSTTVLPRVSATAVDFLLQPYFPGINAKSVLGRLVRMLLARRDAATGGYYLDAIDATYARTRIPPGEPTDRAPGEITPPPFSQVALLHRAIDYHLQLARPEAEWKKKEDLNPQLAALELCLAAGEFEQASDVLAKIDNRYLMRWGHDRLVADLREKLEGHLGGLRFQRYNAAILGICYSKLGFLPKALACHERALKISREQFHEVAETVELSALGYCYQELGQAAKAIEYHAQALTRHRQANNRRAEGTDLSNLGCCYASLGDPARAIEHQEQAIEIARETGDSPREANRQANLAQAMLDAGDVAGALWAAGEAATLAETCDEPDFQVEAMRSLALAGLVAGNLEEARAAIDKARAADVHGTDHSVWTLFGVIALRQGDKEATAKAFRTAIEQADEMLKRTPRHSGALDAKGVALSGLALIEGGGHAFGAAAAFRGARSASRDAGTVLHAMQLLDALAPADPAGILAPVRSAAGRK